MQDDSAGSRTTDGRKAIEGLEPPATIVQPPLTVSATKQSTERDDDGGVIIFLALAFGLPWIVGVATIVGGVVWLGVHG